MKLPHTLSAHLSTLGSAFIGGVASDFAAHITSGIPTTAQSWEAFLVGAVIAGIIAVGHLYKPVPTPPSPTDPTITKGLSP